MKILKCCLPLLALWTACCAATKHDIVAATLILEAGGEKNPQKAMAAVHEVILNRAADRGKSPSQICLQPKQFSCWNGKDIASNIAKAKKHPRWNMALQIVRSPKTNYTKGAQFYHTLSVNPKWNRQMVTTTTIHNHVFYVN